MSKKHTVTIAFEDEDYKALADLAKAEDRTVAGQARHMLRNSLAAQAHLERVSHGLVASLEVPDGDDSTPAEFAASATGLPADTVPSITRKVEQEPLPG